MNNQFGTTLRSLLDHSGAKESNLADKLGYDATYISKWLNGNKLPSMRNADFIMHEIAEFFSEYMFPEDNICRNQETKTILNALQAAYKCDNNFISLQSCCNQKLSFVSGRKNILTILNNAFVQAAQADCEVLSINASFDLFSLYHDDVSFLVRTLQACGAKRIRLTLALDTNILTKNERFYTSSLSDTIGSLDNIEISLRKCDPQQPKLLTVNASFCLQLLWNINDETAVAFSLDRETVSAFSHICGHLLSNAESIFDHAAPEKLRQTNVQLDSYASSRQWLFFNEPPAMLFPDDIMDAFIDEAQTDEYANYLKKLKNIFSTRTAKSNIDLVLYASMINRYLSDGLVNVGNIQHKLTMEQTHAHLKYLSHIMNENPNFNIWLIRDTTMLDASIRRSPSMFIDTISVYIENSNGDSCSNANFHVSMDPLLRNAFQLAFEHMLNQPYCTKLTAEDLLKYL